MTSQSRMRVKRLAGQESGFGVIEVVIAAAVMLIVTMGTLALIDGAQRTSNKNRARAIGANLAEQDQERLRGMGIAQLSNYFATRVATVGGVPYTITSDSDWLRDSTGAPITCTNASGQAEYMRITTTVNETNLNAKKTRAVVIRSIVAPPVGSVGPTQGTLAVEVKNRDGGPQPNIPVTITGPQTATEPTNDLGCAVFNYFKVGTYSVELNSLGYVNPLGVTHVVTSGAVNGGTVNTTAPQLYDRAATINATFHTKDINGAIVTGSQTKYVSAGNAGVGNVTGSRVYGSTSTWSTSLQASMLYPFANGYTMYAGNCAANDPSKYAGTTSTLQAVDPGGTYSVDVYQPALNFTVTKNGAPLTAPAHVTATNTDTGCGEIYNFMTAANGTLTNVGLPFGKYKVCADDNNATAANRLIFRPTTTYTNDKSDKAQAIPAINITTTKGTCP
jgi:Tfp pilus assembly protein PilV